MKPPFLSSDIYEVENLLWRAALESLAQQEFRHKDLVLPYAARLRDFQLGSFLTYAYSDPEGAEALVLRNLRKPIGLGKRQLFEDFDEQLQHDFRFVGPEMLMMTVNMSNIGYLEILSSDKYPQLFEPFTNIIAIADQYRCAESEKLALLLEKYR